MEHQCDAGFHIEDAGAGQFVAVGTARHGGERAQRVDRVVVTEQQDRLTRLAGEVRLQVIAEVFCLVNPDLAAELGKFLGNRLGDAVDSGLVVAGRFDFDQLADGRYDFVAALVEIGKATLHFRVRLRTRSTLRDCNHFAALPELEGIKLSHPWPFGIVREGSLL